MDFNNIWQQCISEHDGVSSEHDRVSHMYLGSYAQGQGHIIELSIYI